MVDNLVIFITAKTISAEGAPVEQVFNSKEVREFQLEALGPARVPGRLRSVHQRVPAAQQEGQPVTPWRRIATKLEVTPMKMRIASLLGLLLLGASAPAAHAQSQQPILQVSMVEIEDFSTRATTSAPELTAARVAISAP